MTLRTLTPLRRDMGVHYADQVAERRIDRAAWAAEVQRLIDEECGGNRSAFAKLVDVGYKTVGRWLKEEVDVSEESVRQVARKLSLVSADLLLRVGYYKPADLLPAPAPTAEDLADDPALREIEESDYPPHMKARWRSRLYELRAQRAAAEVQEVRWWMDQQAK